MPCHIGPDSTVNVLLFMRLVLFLSLLTCGDVEANPGPNTRQMTLTESLQEKHSTQDTGKPIDMDVILRELRGVKTELGNKMDTLIKNLDNKVDKLGKDVNELKEGSKRTEEVIKSLSEENVSLRKTIDELTKDLDSMKGQMRRDNLIFHGIGQDRKESWDDTESKVKRFITHKLDVPSDDMKFERVHRLTNATSVPQPIIAKFSHFKDRDQVLRSARANLKYRKTFHRE